MCVLEFESHDWREEGLDWCTVFNNFLIAVGNFLSSVGNFSFSSQLQTLFWTAPICTKFDPVQVQKSTVLTPLFSLFHSLKI